MIVTAKKFSCKLDCLNALEYELSSFVTSHNYDLDDHVTYEFYRLLIQHKINHDSSLITIVKRVNKMLIKQPIKINYYKTRSTGNVIATITLCNSVFCMTKQGKRNTLKCENSARANLRNLSIYRIALRNKREASYDYSVQLFIAKYRQRYNCANTATVNLIVSLLSLELMHNLLGLAS